MCHTEKSQEHFPGFSFFAGKPLRHNCYNSLQIRILHECLHIQATELIGVARKMYDNELDTDAKMAALERASENFTVERI